MAQPSKCSLCILANVHSIPDNCVKKQAVLKVSLYPYCLVVRKSSESVRLGFSKKLSQTPRLKSWRDDSVALTALPEDLSFIPSTYTRAHIICGSSSRKFNTLLVSVDTWPICSLQNICR